MFIISLKVYIFVQTIKWPDDKYASMLHLDEIKPLTTKIGGSNDTRCIKVLLLTNKKL